METADDRKRKEGAPSSLPAKGPPEEIHNFFGDYSLPRLTAWVLGILGAVVTAAGAILFVVPLMIVGGVMLLLAVVAFFGGRQLVR